MAEKNLKDLFLHTLKDVYFAEHEILKALPKMAEAAQVPELRQAFETHRTQTERSSRTPEWRLRLPERAAAR